MLLPPNVNYPCPPTPQQAQQPLNEDELTDADTDFDFSRYQQRFLTNAEAKTAKQEQEELAQLKKQGSTNAMPKLTRCTNCKRTKKKCDLVETGLPCTTCRRGKLPCVGCDILRLQTVFPKKAKDTRKPAPGMSAPLATGHVMAAAPTPGPAPEFQGIDSVESRLFGRDEAPPRARSISLQGEALFSDKCDNCERHERCCEDTRPCFECMEHNLVCYGTYMDNPYRSTDDDSDDPENGWATFGPNFGLCD
jgi:hypothetical protein